MDRYHVWCDLKEGVGDLAFSADLAAFLDHLQEAGHVEGWTLERRKLGFGPPELGEFHVVMETRDMAQLQVVYDVMTARTGATEKLHAKVWSKVTNLRFALYRDFPDANRAR